ncbi:MrcB family domain-containing protein [Psychrobacter fozii]|uniref:5-methylcytosine-specific restriction endonuclease McrBC GTP-binding regulatory subunit McrB n=1 Tax=Psychrobacter fozii TaxID=198480 RepID=A0A2V4VC19_9GAMM|nr:DUF3578 domain-containing protein [Psychrobacter fozii]PYE39808.1 5-methylcytosine-specific restriction endonuclease McrBC GTP-binding regulatory subunit McrB [Psychrobacter fozii]
MTDMNLAEKLIEFTSNWVQATKEPFTSHPTANFLRNDLKEEIATIVKKFDKTYGINASAGAGNWANIPWISILNPEITTSTQDGIYPVYLFRADGSGFYLSLNQGTTIPTKELGKAKAERRAESIKQYLLTQLPKLNVWGQKKIDLYADTALGKSYETYNIVAKYYDISTDLNSTQLKNDFLELLNIYKQIQPIYKELKTTDFDSQPKLQTQLNASAVMKKSLPDDITPLSKPFLLLAGISGTGKTRFVREQAKATGSLSDTYCLTSVRPDWHEPSDILGYISRLGGDGNAEYITTDVLQFIAKAWREIIDAKLELTVDDDCPLTVTGNKDELNKVRPYWLCLDEMNLAPVEQYFADYLSILETREWQWHDNESFDYRCDPLLKSATIGQLKDKNKNELRNALGFADGKYDREWELFCKHGLSLPFNLVVAGTVNMDETTHGFSRKVIDRALSFDFGDFFPNEFDDFFEPTVTHNALSYPIDSQATIENLSAIDIDSDGSKSINFLKSINKVLDNTPFKLAFRALNELLLAVISTQPTDERQLQAVWDDFLMCKVLPRIEGDYDKLAIINKAISSNEQSLLTELAVILQQALSDIWSTTNDTNKQRPDLYRKNKEGNALNIACRSKAKLAWMQQRLERSGFTSFWP